MWKRVKHGCCSGEGHGPSRRYRTSVGAAISALAVALVPVVSANADVVFVADQVGNTIQTFDSETGAFIGTFASAADGDFLAGPRNLSIGPNGNLWAVNFSSSGNARQLVSFDINTGATLGAWNITTWTEEPTEVMFLNNQAYVLGNDTRNVAVYNLDGTFVREFGGIGLGIPNGAMIDPNGMMHITTLNTSLGSNARNEVQIWDPISGTQVGAYGIGDLPRFDAILDIAQSADGLSNYVLNWSDGSILEFNADTLDLESVLAANLDNARTLQIAPDGSLMVSTVSGIMVLNEATGVFETFIDTAGAGMIRPTGFVFAPTVPGAPTMGLLAIGLFAGSARRRR